MAGPLATLKSRFASLTERREDAHSRAIMQALEPKAFLGFSHYPTAHEFGDFNAARGALKGEITIHGQKFALTDLTPWTLSLPAQNLTGHLHRFGWLGEFAALSSKAARARATGWLLGWLDRYEDGTGPAPIWAPDVVAERLLSMVTHTAFLADALSDDAEQRVINALSAHLAYGLKTLDEANGNITRIMATLDLLQSALCFKGFEGDAVALQQRLEQDCGQHLSHDGAIPSRNPERLLTLFQKLIWTGVALDETNHARGPAHSKSIKLIAPVLRALRHGDGSLARFHGGSGGRHGALDRALAESRIRTREYGEASMGFVQLRSSRLVAIMDCARPPSGPDAMTAHASTLGFELSSGRRPIVVSVGPGATFGPDWARSPRTTTSHSALALDKTSSSQLAQRPTGPDPHNIELVSRPSMVTVSKAGDHSGSWLQARQDGYIEDYGLLHERRLFVGAMGREAHGEDVLFSPESKAERRFAQRIKGSEKLGVGLSVHFHLHPDVDATFLRETDTIRLLLKNGETWNFRQNGGQIDLETSAYLDPELPEPVATKQIVLRARATTHKAEVSWSFVRHHADGPAVRDTAT